MYIPLKRFIADPEDFNHIYNDSELRHKGSGPVCVDIVITRSDLWEHRATVTVVRAMNKLAHP